MKIALSNNYGLINQDLLKVYYKLKSIEPFVYYFKNRCEIAYLVKEDVEFLDNFLISKNYLGEETSRDSLYSNGNLLDYSDIDRTDLDFIKAVEITKDKTFKIIEIPDDVKFKIDFDSEDGREYVIETHRIWS